MTSLKPQGIIMATGSTEQHGPIGLIGTDTICSETIASGVAQRQICTSHLP